MATGRVDAMVYALGMLAGLALYAEAYPAIEGWTKSTALGELTWPDLLGVPRGVVVFAVVLLAGAMFWGATQIERLFADRRPAA
jgi:hypothetical protein